MVGTDSSQTAPDRQALTTTRCSDWTHVLETASTASRFGAPSRCCSGTMSARHRSRKETDFTSHRSQTRSSAGSHSKRRPVRCVIDSGSLTWGVTRRQVGHRGRLPICTTSPMSPHASAARAETDYSPSMARHWRPDGCRTLSGVLTKRRRATPEPCHLSEGIGQAISGSRS